MRSLSCGERAILQQDGDEEPIGDHILSQRTLTARVAHGCDHCPEEDCILPGERYTQLVGLDADMGAFFIRRYCTGKGCSRAIQPPPERVVHIQAQEVPDGDLPF
ncbi:MAG: hypothetical protein K2X54_27200 [Methylobacterium organophilum]|nr:hypothetical protein [Methylobacterium organophilum]